MPEYSDHRCPYACLYVCIIDACIVCLCTIEGKRVRDPIDFRLGILLVLDDDSLPIVLESVGHRSTSQDYQMQSCVDKMLHLKYAMRQNRQNVGANQYLACARRRRTIYNKHMNSTRRTVKKNEEDEESLDGMCGV